MLILSPRSNCMQALQDFRTQVAVQGAYLMQNSGAKVCFGSAADLAGGTLSSVAHLPTPLRICHPRRRRPASTPDLFVTPPKRLDKSGASGSRGGCHLSSTPR
jgi:hypothetical protein